MKAGDLRHHVTLLRPSSEVDARGRTLTAWAEAASVFASMADVSGRDYYAAYAAGALDTVTFGLRYREDVTPAWRIRHGGSIYEILQINRLGYRGDFMHVKARLLQNMAKASAVKSVCADAFGRGSNLGDD